MIVHDITLSWGMLNTKNQTMEAPELVQEVLVM